MSSKLYVKLYIKLKYKMLLITKKFVLLTFISRIKFHVFLYIIVPFKTVWTSNIKLFSSLYIKQAEYFKLFSNFETRN